VNRRRFVKSLGMSAALGVLSEARGHARAADGPMQAGEDLAPNPVWPTPILVPIPDSTAGVEKPAVSLNGTWKFTLNPPARFWSNAADLASWKDIAVPGECTMQGFEIARDTEYPFKRAVAIPEDFRGKKIFLRFDGVYSYGRVWANGNLVRAHRGGFTSWDCDITSFVTPGKLAWITAGVTDESDNISWQSNYAKHYIGGILRDVRLIALPRDHATGLHVETDFDSAFKDAVLRVTAGMALESARDAKLEFRLKDANGMQVPIHPSSLRLSQREPQAAVGIPVERPTKWDSEHPRLYTLEASVIVNGSVVQTLSRRFGFRSVQARGNQLYVNGDPVKLRGGCRHDVYPTRGRSTTPALDARDARLLKGANFNFVRTSHYPPSEAFLEACDRHGLYVEEETAVCFVNGQHGPQIPAQNDPRYTAQFMNQFAEMIERDRDHPCVILWSLGNESEWGANFAREYDYVKAEDGTRPVIFSYPESVPQGVNAYDVFSEHYPKFDAKFSSPSLPKLNDEFGHISCYNQNTLRRDPGVRNDWGKSIQEFWKGMFPAQGCLGGSIWASIDEVFMLPEACAGYGEWGILDGWRREKPEYWLAKKAYSPARIAESYVKNPGSGNPLETPIRNEFNHTNLNEVRIEWRAGSDRGEIRDFNLAPRAAGLLKIPGRAWRNGETLSLEFFGPQGSLLDRYELPVGRPVRNFSPAQGPAPQVEEDSETLRVAGGDFEIAFSKASGLIRRATYKGHAVLDGGPVLNLAPYGLRNWWLSGLKTAKTSDETVVEMMGSYQREGESSDELVVYAQFQVRIDGAGLITTNFKVQGLPQKLYEIGVAYILPRDADRLSWSRQALWSAYPPDHIGRKEGMANKLRLEGADEFRVEPSWPWSQDMKDFFLFGKDDSGGRGTNDFRSQKENIWLASCAVSGPGVRARAESDGTHAVRAEIQEDGRVRMNINCAWAYPDLDWGNDCPLLPASSDYQGSTRLRLTDNDSVNISFKDS
jgi:hypothetical protein